MSAKQFREFADENLQWARTAKSEKEQRIFLRMAEAWLDVARRWDAESPVDNRARTSISYAAEEAA
jgi:hypothetical protein